MRDLLDTYIYGDVNTCEADDYDEQKIMLSALHRVLPLIIENELTKMQSICLRMYCLDQISQREIAQRLGLSQPTVCRHIKLAKEEVRKYLNYCFFCIKKTNEQWLKLF